MCGTHCFLGEQMRVLLETESLFKLCCSTVTDNVTIDGLNPFNVEAVAQHCMCIATSKYVRALYLPRAQHMGNFYVPPPPNLVYPPYYYKCILHMWVTIENRSIGRPDSGLAKSRDSSCNYRMQS